MKIGLVVLVAATSGCRGPQLGFEVEPVKGPYGAAPVRPGRIWGGTCEPKLQVHVVDAEGKPVGGARVWLAQRVSIRAVEEPMGINEYRTLPVVSDQDGVAWVCRPEDMPEVSAWNGIGGGSVETDRGVVYADLGPRRGTLSPPFEKPLMIAPAETK